MTTNIFAMVYNAVYTFVSNICFDVAWGKYADADNALNGLDELVKVMHEFYSLKSFWAPFMAEWVTVTFMILCLIACAYIANKVVRYCINTYRNTKNVEVEL